MGTVVCKYSARSLSTLIFRFAKLDSRKTELRLDEPPNVFNLILRTSSVNQLLYVLSDSR